MNGDSLTPISLQYNADNAKPTHVGTPPSRVTVTADRGAWKYERTVLLVGLPSGQLTLHSFVYTHPEVNQFSMCLLSVNQLL